MKVCIIGSGNIGMYLGSYIALDKKNDVYINTSKPECFGKKFEIIREEIGETDTVEFKLVSNSLEDCVKDSEIIFLTYPSFMVGEALEEIYKYVKRGTMVGVIPGFGGAEAYKEKFLEKGCIFFGSQRVPSITRLKEYGKSVCLKEKNKFMKIGVFPKSYGKEVAHIITGLIDIETEALDSYLAITLSPSNPTMHPSRLYELFSDYKEGKIYDYNPYFYEEWGNKASKMLLDLDEELSLIINNLGFSEDRSFEKIKERFNVETSEQLSEKIKKAPGFKGIRSPMIEKDNGVIPDLASRYFLEDIEFGTCIIKGFAEVLNIDTPYFNEIIMWGQKLLGKEYLVSNKLIGKDSKELLIPRNLGLNTKEEILKFYK